MSAPDHGAGLSRHEDGFAAFFSFGMAAAAALVYVQWRGPWGFSSGLLYCFLGFAALLLFGPIVLRWSRRPPARYAVLLLGLLAVMTDVGWVAGYFPAVGRLRWVLATAGWAALLAAVVRTALAGWRTCLVSLAFTSIGIGLGAWTTLWCYTSFDMLNPVLVELFERGALPHPDTIYLTSMSNMIRYYGVPSTGLRGTPYNPYHSAVLAVFAWLSNLLDTQTFVTFVVGMPLLLIPLCYGAVLRCALLLQRLFGDARLLSSIAAAVLIAVCTVGVFSAPTDAAAAVWHSNLNSETDAFSLFLLFSTIEIALLLLWKQAKSSEVAGGIPKDVALGLSAFVLAAAITYSKGPVGIMYASGFGWMALRTGFGRRRPGFAMSVGTAVGFILAFAVVRETGAATIVFSLGHFFLSHVKMGWLSFVLVYYLWPICACVVLWSLAGMDAARAPALNAAAEALVFLMIAAMLPGLLLNLGGGAADYFSNVAVLVGLAALAAFAPMLVETLPSGREWLKPLPAKVTITALLVWGVGLGAGLNALPLYKDAVVRRNNILKLLESTKPTPMMASLAKLRALPFTDRRQVLVDIPTSRDDYWKTGLCQNVPFMVPSLAGFAFLDGRPDVRCEAAQYYGYPTYPARDISKESPGAPLCSRRPDAKYRYIVSLAQTGSTWTIVDCQNQPR